jgi:hypothetical protein
MMVALAAAGVIAVGFLAGASFRSLTRTPTPEDRAVASSDKAFSSQLVEDVMEPSVDQTRATPRSQPPAVADLAPEAALPEAAPTATTRPKRTPKPAPAKAPKGAMGESPVVGSQVASTQEDMPAVIVAPVAPVPSDPWTMDAQGVLRVDQARLAAPASYLQLLREWGIEVDMEPFSEASPADVALYDMRAMVGQLDFKTYSTEELDSALKLDLPIMIKHGAGVLGSAPTAAIVRRFGDRLEVADPQNGLKEFTLEELAARVQEIIVMYPDPHRLTGLKSGDTGAGVETLQRALTSFGALEGKVDGIFGPQVRQALREFQKVEGLTASGKVDAATAALISSRIEPARPRLSS